MCHGRKLPFSLIDPGGLHCLPVTSPFLPSWTLIGNLTNGDSDVKCWQISLELNSKGLYQISGKEKENCCFVFPSSTKREIRHFHVVVEQRGQRNVQKSVMHVQSCYLVNLNLLVYCRSRCRRRRRCLRSLLCRDLSPSQGVYWLRITYLNRVPYVVLCCSLWHAFNAHRKYNQYSDRRNDFPTPLPNKTRRFVRHVFYVVAKSV